LPRVWRCLLMSRETRLDWSRMIHLCFRREHRCVLGQLRQIESGRYMVLPEDLKSQLVFILVVL
jgi:hypothetical protein